MIMWVVGRREISVFSVFGLGILEYFINLLMGRG